MGGNSEGTNVAHAGATLDEMHAGWWVKLEGEESELSRYRACVPKARRSTRSPFRRSNQRRWKTCSSAPGNAADNNHG